MEIYLLLLSFITAVYSQSFTPGSLDTFVLNEHNRYRRMENAANMKKMVWSDKLARVAQSWADTCKQHHQNIGYGENLYMHTRSNYVVKDLVIKAMNAWYDKRDLWRWGDGFSMATGHYTQLVWSKTKVGCGIKTDCPAHGSLSRTYMYIACFYDPAGNFGSENPYIQGTPCSACPGQCDQGLCTGTTMKGGIYSKNGNTWNNNNNNRNTWNNNNNNDWNSWDNNNDDWNSWDNNNNNWDSWDNNNNDDWNSWDNNNNNWDSWDNNNNDDWNSWDNNNNDWNSWDNNNDDWNSWDNNNNNWDSWDNNNNDDWNSWDNNNDDWNSWDNNNNNWDSWDKNNDDWNSWENNNNNWDSWDYNNDDWKSWDNNNDNWDSRDNNNNGDSLDTDNWWKRGKIVRRQPASLGSHSNMKTDTRKHIAHLPIEMKQKAILRKLETVKKDRRN